MRDPLRQHKQAAPARRLLRPLPHPLHVFNLQVKIHPTSRGVEAAACRSTWNLEVDERGVELGARAGTLEPSLGLVVESVERAAERAGPAPALQIAVAAQVRPALLAAWDAVPAGAGGRGLAALVGGGEGRHGDAPLDGARLQRLRRGREAGDRGSHRHGRGSGEVGDSDGEDQPDQAASGGGEGRESSGLGSCGPCCCKQSECLTRWGYTWGMEMDSPSLVRDGSRPFICNRTLVRSLSYVTEVKVAHTHCVSARPAAPAAAETERVTSHRRRTENLKLYSAYELFESISTENKNYNNTFKQTW